MEPTKLAVQENKQKIKNKSRIGTLIAFFSIAVYLLLLGYFTYLNHQEIEKSKQSFSLLQQGTKIRNSYDTLRRTSVDTIAYSELPDSLIELNARENILYSYRDDRYYDYSSPKNTNINTNKLVIYLTDRQTFDDPIAVAKQPECEAMVRIETEKRTPSWFEGQPAEISLKRKDKQDTGTKVYVYTPKLKHCEKVFKDERMLRVAGYANTIRYSF